MTQQSTEIFEITTKPTEQGVIDTQTNHRLLGILEVAKKNGFLLSQQEEDSLKTALLVIENNSEQDSQELYEENDPPLTEDQPLSAITTIDGSPKTGEEIRRQKDLASIPDYDPFLAESNFCRLYDDILEPFVALTADYRWYLTNNISRIPVDYADQHLKFPDTNTPTKDFGVVYIMENNCLDNFGRPIKRIKIGKACDMRERLMTLRRDHIKNNRLSKEHNVRVIFTAPHRNHAATEKFFHKMFTGARMGRQEFFEGVSVVDFFIQSHVLTETELPFPEIIKLSAPLHRYSNNVENHLTTALLFDRDPQSRAAALLLDIALGYPFDHLMGKYKVTQQQLKELIESDEFKDVGAEYPDLHTPNGLNKLKLARVKGQTLDMMLHATSDPKSKSFTPRDFKELAMAQDILLKGMVVCDNKVRKSKADSIFLHQEAPTSKKGKHQEIEVLPPIIFVDEDDNEV